MNGLKVFIISMIPILEQKAAIPIGLAAGMDKMEVFIISLIGATLPSIFIMYGVRLIFPFLRKIKYLGDLIRWIEKRTLHKGKKIVKYELIGLFLFVAIPLPGTGVWTGSLAASLLELKIRKSVLVIFLAAIISGMLIMFGSDMLINMYKWIFV